MSFHRLAALPLLLAMTLPALAAPPSLDFLAGEWTGAGSGEPGKGMGSFSFTSELQGQVLVRRSHSEYPATAQRPATVHEDLTVVYANRSKAVYFDNEGHVIHYDITMNPDGRGATFLSTDPSPAPLFRLTYQQQGPEDLLVSFDMAFDGKASSLKPYVSGVVHRVQTPGH